MTLLTRIEFAEKCEMANRNLGNYIRRKNIVLNEDGLIDLSDKVNSDFLKKRERYLAKKKGIELEPQEEKKPEKKPEPPPAEKKSNQKPGAVQAYVTEKEAVELEKKKAEAAMYQAKYEAMIGNLIPKDLMKKIMTILGQSFQVHYKDGAESILAEIAHKKKLNKKESAQLRTALYQSINESHERSIELAKKQLKEILKDLSKTNGNAKKSA